MPCSGAQGPKEVPAPPAGLPDKPAALGQRTKALTPTPEGPREHGHGFPRKGGRAVEGESSVPGTWVFSFHNEVGWAGEGTNPSLGTELTPSLPTLDLGKELNLGTPQFLHL